MNDVQMLSELEVDTEVEQAENERFRTYTFVDIEKNEQRKFTHMVLSESTIVVGGLAVFAIEAEKPRYYTVKSVDDGARRVELTACKNAYGKIVLLFVLLGLSWLLIDFITKNIF